MLRTARLFHVHGRGLRAVALTSLVAGMSLVGVWLGGVRINETTSLPRGIWRVADTAIQPIQRGDVVYFCPPASAALALAISRGYLNAGRCPSGSQPMFKPVAALPGDRIRLTAAGLSVNGQPVPASAPVATDPAGRRLPDLAPLDTTVADGELWVISGHTSLSYDSRYMGPIRIADVDGVATPVWVEAPDA